MASKKQKLWQNAVKVLMSMEYTAKSEKGFSIIDDLYKGNKKKATRDVEKGILATSDDAIKLLHRAWFRHNQQKQNHMNAHSRFYECSQLKLKLWELEGIGHSNGGGNRYNIDEKIVKQA